eukprot:scaffold2441_cov105-Cylindrotheca_fusiformis.AAC.2
MQSILFQFLLFLAVLLASSAITSAFSSYDGHVASSVSTSTTTTTRPAAPFLSVVSLSAQNKPHYPTIAITTSRSLQLAASSNNDNNNDTQKQPQQGGGQVVLGIAGTVASLVMLYSEFTLKTTGCGLPAGPFGLVGLIEGISYLGVIGIFAYSIVTKIQTGSGLPAGPFGLIGAAEGLSYLAILAGIIVLTLQIINYGYIPNAVPMEGGMCN